MGNRLDLQNLLEDILVSENVYFQPPESIKLKYPCIKYSISKSSSMFANNYLYRNVKGYQLIIIDKDPDSDIPDKISKLQMCSFDRAYTADGLNHFVYNIYY